MLDHPSVSILILNFNGLPFIKKCLNSVLRTDYPNFEILFVDNGSLDGSIDIVKSTFKCPHLKIVENAQNMGYSCVNNVVSTFVRSQIIAFLDIDTEVNPNWLKEAVSVLEAEKENGAVQPKLLMMNKLIDGVGDVVNRFGFSTMRGHGEKDFGQYDKKEEIFSARGAALITKRRIFEEIGGVDPVFFIHLWDVDIGWRLRLAGYKVVLAPKAEVYHSVHHATGKLPLSTKLFHSYKNRITMLSKNYGSTNLLKCIWVPIYMLILGMVVDIVKKGAVLNVRRRISVLPWILKNFNYIWKSRLQVQRKIRKVPDDQVTCHMLKSLFLTQK